MINIVIPMAGLGKRFSSEGYKLPKPLIDVAGTTMIERVLENLKIKNAKFILIVQKKHYDSFPKVFDKIKSKHDLQYIFLDYITEGPAKTVYLAKKLINNDKPLLICNSDQIIDIDFNHFVDYSLSNFLDGLIMTFKSDDPKWSYVKTEENLVTEVKEKIVISENATTGVYFFNQGKQFIDAAEKMFEKKEKYNNEYYVCPVYNSLINKHTKVGIYEIQEYQMHGTGTPEDLNKYLEFLNEKI